MLTPLGALGAVVSALERREPVPSGAAAVLIAAWRRYQSGESFEVAFRAKVRQGGRYETPGALARFRHRDALILELWNSLKGRKTERARRVIDVFSGRATVDDARLADVVAQLQQEFRADLPTSAKQIARIADGEGIHHRRTA